MMRRASAGLVVLGLAFVALSTGLSTERDAHMQLLSNAKANPMDHFRVWVQQHSREYRDNAAELAKRFSIWLSNLEYVLEYNARHTSHWLGMNNLADLTQQEYRQRFLGYSLEKKKQNLAGREGYIPPGPFRYAKISANDLPSSIDWREKNAVTEVKNQLQCGSCWAFSTTGSVEGVSAIATKKLVSLSEQELVDCDTLEDQGCGGGLMDYAYQFIIRNKGITTEDAYPYTGEDGVCDRNQLATHVVTIDGYEDVPENDELSLKKAVAHQPVSVAIEADQKAFQLYMGGVMADESCGTQLDHGVLVVGYGYDEESALPYWIVKNSWGPEWGDSGYIRLRMGSAAAEGLCGIAMAASYPTKKDGPGPEPGPSPSPVPPRPEPVQCDETSECPHGSTCCCALEFLNMCLQWGCCPIEDAVCCEDKTHCCPSSRPVCDVEEGTCNLEGEKKSEHAQPWYTKTTARRHWPSSWSSAPGSSDRKQGHLKLGRAPQ